jgi:predicted Zn-dependent protease
MGTTINRDEFLDQINGMVFGPNPREGFFRENMFYHPDLKFLFEFPEDWETSNMKQAVVGVSPDQYAVIQIAITDKKSIKEAADEFFGHEGLSAEQPETGKINGMPAISGVFTVPTEQVVLQGYAAFISYKKNTYQVLGYTTEEKWPDYEPDITASARSFNRLTDKKILSVKPMRLKIITLDKEMTLAEFADRYPSPVSIETLALINNVGRNKRLPAGSKLKQVVGKKVQ